MTDKRPLIDRSKYNTKTAFVLGYTGEVGKALVRRLLSEAIFSKLVLIGRRRVDYGDDPLYDSVEQKVIDFDNLNEYKDVFSGVQIGFCCLGTTVGKAGKAAFYKIDYGYSVSCARLAKEMGCQQFFLVTSLAADPDSVFFYLRVKGEIERDIAAIGFNRFAVFRPACLLCDRTTPRLGDRAAKTLTRPLRWLDSTLATVPTDTVGKAIVWTLFVDPARCANEAADGRCANEAADGRGANDTADTSGDNECGGGRLEIVKNQMLHCYGEKFDVYFRR